MRAKLILSLLLLTSIYSITFAQYRMETFNRDTLISRQTELPAGEQTLEQAIDPKEYVIGPGDVLSIVLWDEFQTTYNLKVTPEGEILIPRVGSLLVSGKTLEEVKSGVKEEVLKKYRNIEITVSLLNLRKFKVSVTGAVVSPGVYSAYANERVSEIIQRAGRVLPNSTTRNIILKRNDGSQKKIDILRFLKTGDNERNPYVLDGDIIYVPLKDIAMYYGIYGAVKDPGEYEYSEDDSLLDLINLAGGLEPDADLSKTEIVRFASDNKNTQTFKEDLTPLFIAGNRGKNIPLIPGDRFFIRSTPDFKEKKQVNINGEVLYPGVYAIEEGKTRLLDLISLAGGFTEEASLEEAEMIREYIPEKPDLEYERLKKIPVADMKSYEYEYFKTKSRERPGRASIDFVKLFKGGDPEENILLIDKDEVFIPRKNLAVKVTGSVVNPGFLSYEPGKDYSYYIKKAGGFSWRASTGKVKLIKSTTGEWKKPDRSIEPGDVIWVPEKSEKSFLSTFKDVITVISSAATLYLVINNATK
ncbi:MAG: SLBB domain-containing protein [candidate division Zixibacteria bacterium]|nr:SLBB domain-containing protein [candidate division Zixibacteria bacterium]